MISTATKLALVGLGLAMTAGSVSAQRTVILRQNSFVSETFGGLLSRFVEFDEFDPMDAALDLQDGERAELVAADLTVTYQLNGTYSVFNNTNEVQDIADGLAMNITVEFAGASFNSVSLPPNITEGMFLNPGETAEFFVNGPAEGTTVVELGLDLPLSSLTGLTAFGLIDASPFEPDLSGITVNVLRELTYTVQVVPTPATAALFGLGGVWASRRRRG